MRVDVYEGDYEDDKFNGLGRMTYNSGDIYEGEFKNNRMDGRGKCYFVTGDVYEGSFKEHDVDGEGRFIYANGVVYNAEKDTIEEWDLDSGGGAATASPTVTNDVRTQARNMRALGQSFSARKSSERSGDNALRPPSTSGPEERGSRLSARGAGMERRVSFKDEVETRHIPSDYPAAGGGLGIKATCSCILS